MYADFSTPERARRLEALFERKLPHNSDFQNASTSSRWAGSGQGNSGTEWQPIFGRALKSTIRPMYGPIEPLALRASASARTGGYGFDAMLIGIRPL